MRDPKIIIQPGGPDDVWTFEVPTYKVMDDGLQDAEPMILKLCRGDKSDPLKPRQPGVFTETLLQVCVDYLTHVNKGELANRDTSIAITHIEDALLRIGKRAEDRKRREVQGTYKK